MIVGKSVEENENSGDRCTGRRWQEGFTCSNRVPMILVGFHLPSEVKKKLHASISNTPARMNSLIKGSVFLGTKIRLLSLC